MKTSLIVLLVCAVLLSGCAGFVAQPTETPVPSATVTATATLTASPVPPTATLTATTAPTSTPKPSATPTEAGLPIPEGTLQVEWEGVPVMPGATAGEGDSDGYSFVVPASVEAVKEYYIQQISALGWDLLGVGEGGKVGSVLLIFTKGTATLSAAIIPLDTHPGVVYVLLVK